MTNHNYLCGTSFLFVLSLLYFLVNLKNKPWVECAVASFLVPTAVLSQLFWKNPVRGSILHKIDAVVAKITLFSCSLYTLLYKFKITFVVILAAIGVSFYFSNYYSTLHWCSNPHLICHGSLHVLCFIALFYTFDHR